LKLLRLKHSGWSTGQATGKGRAMLTECAHGDHSWLGQSESIRGLLMASLLSPILTLSLDPF